MPKLTDDLLADRSAATRQKIGLAVAAVSAVPAALVTAVPVPLNFISFAVTLIGLVVAVRITNGPKTKAPRPDRKP